MLEIAPLNIIINNDGMVIAAAGAGVSILSLLVRSAVMDKEAVDQIKEQIKEQQEVMKKATKKGNEKKAKKAQEKMMELTMENMKQSFKPMIFTFIPIILIIGWLRGEFTGAGTVATVFGFDLTWFWWYLLTAMFISLIANKVFKLT